MLLFGKRIFLPEKSATFTCDDSVTYPLIIYTSLEDQQKFVNFIAFKPISILRN